MKLASSEGVSSRELLKEAIARHCPIALSCRVVDGWAGFYSKFLQTSTDPAAIVLEYPWGDGRCVPELVQGQVFGISFRRGPKRCVFTSNMLATRRISFNHVEMPAILIEFPAEIFELQRRLDYRAPTPVEGRINVSAGASRRPPTHASLLCADG